MAKLILVCGSTGAGKTTYSISLAKQTGAVKFSIDPWMVTLFAKDMTELDYTWMMERVQRCYEQIWEVSSQILALDGQVVLDLGFTTKEQRQEFVERAKAIGCKAELHYLDTPVEMRKQRVEQRNADQDPQVYSFEVTDMMFNFIEKRFEVPDADELAGGCIVPHDYASVEHS